MKVLLINSDLEWSIESLQCYEDGDNDGLRRALVYRPLWLGVTPPLHFLFFSFSYTFPFSCIFFPYFDQALPSSSPLTSSFLPHPPFFLLRAIFFTHLTFPLLHFLLAFLLILTFLMPFASSVLFYPPSSLFLVHFFFSFFYTCPSSPSSFHTLLILTFLLTWHSILFFFFLSYPPSSLLGAFTHLSLVQYFGRTFCHGRGHSSTLDAPHVAKPRHSLLRHAYYCGAVSLSLLLFFLEVEVQHPGPCRFWPNNTSAGEG